MPSEEFDFNEIEKHKETNEVGQITVSEDVIMSVAIDTLSKVTNVKPSTSGFMSDLYHGKKTSSGVRVFCEEAGKCVIRIDVFVLVKYGLRIPDVCWDVQEGIKTRVEEVTGLSVDSVNIYVQGIYFEEEPKPDTASLEK
ncbi:MAG: Asp23/Gls24 family envelope stress response protein [Synergistaceae bacterium]|nr:Asp23/Gls24 family envelope stress response protein [Synergistaceae bacterium]